MPLLIYVFFVKSMWAYTALSVLPNSCSRGLGNLRRCRWGEMAKAHHPPKIPYGEEPTQLEGVIKGRVRTGRQAQNGKCQEGCSDGNAATAASLEPELCLGKAAQWSLCSVQSPPCSTAECSWCLFPRFGSPPQGSLHSAQWLCQNTTLVELRHTFNVLISASPMSHP